MALVISGRIRHPSKQPSEIHTALMQCIPNLIISGVDFSVERGDCKVEFFCNATSTLDFTVTTKRGIRTPTATVAILVRETNRINDVLTKALSRRFGRAQVEFCLLEDESSKSELLYWEKGKSPLWVAPAKLSYALSLALVVLGCFIAWNHTQEATSSFGDLDVISLLAAFTLPALTLPLPFVYEQLTTQGMGRWFFSQRGGNS